MQATNLHTLDAVLQLHSKTETLLRDIKKEEVIHNTTSHMILIRGRKK